MQNWLNNNLGKTHLNPDPPHGDDGQCVNAASSWSMAQGGPELFGIGSSSTAWTIWQTFRHPFYQVINGGNVEVGDIVFYPPNEAGEGTGSAGHVDICIGSITGSLFQGADANYNNNLNLTKNTHQKINVAGVFRPVGGGDMSITDINTCRRIAYFVWGINGVYNPQNALNGDWDNNFKSDPNWLGAETNTCLQTRSDAPEAHAYEAWLTKAPTPDGAIADKDFVIAWCYQNYGYDPFQTVDQSKQALVGTTVRNVINTSGSDQATYWNEVKNGNLVPKGSTTPGTVLKPGNYTVK